MKRREFIAAAGGLTLGATGLFDRAAGAVDTSADSLAKHRLAAIEFKPVDTSWPRPVGRNAVKGAHGHKKKQLVCLLKTDQEAKAGTWTYRVSFSKGKGVAVNDSAIATPLPDYEGKTGKFEIAPTDKSGRDFRGKGRLQYVGQHYLCFAGNGEYFLKAGPDAPETLLGYADFDDTKAVKKNVPLKSWQPHVKDWNSGDPTWKDGQGKGLIGALNYLASKGCNGFSFLTYNDRSLRNWINVYAEKF